MNRPNGWISSIIGLIAILTCNVSTAQNFSNSNYPGSADSPAARMRPIGSASAVDQYRQPAVSQSAVNQPVLNRSAETSPALLRETGYRSAVSNAFPQSNQPTFEQPNLNPGAVRQTAMQFGFPTDAGSSVGPPVTSPVPPNFSSPGGSSGAVSATPLPPGPVPTLGPAPQMGAVPQQGPNSQFGAAPQFGQGNPPATLPFPAPNAAAPIGPRSDYAPMNSPSLGGSIANINNCANVTGPSGYSAAFSSPCGGCAPVSYQAPVPQAYQAPPAQIAAPALVPGGLLPPTALAAPAAVNPAPVGSLLSFGQERYPVQVGQGLLGQPTAYVPGQTFRNWIRYLTP